MKKLLVLFFVLVMCAPSYGDILVYKLAGQFNPYVLYDNNSYNAATVTTVRITSYIVVDVDLATDSFNYTPAWVLYDTKHKLYHYCEASEPTFFYRYNIKGTAKKGMYFIIYPSLGDTVTWDCTFYGVCSEISTDGTYKILMPKSLKGSMAYISLSSPVSDGIGNANLSLDLKYTQAANRAGMTQNAVVNKIAADLEAKGYRAY